MDKSPDAFRTISEVSDWLETPAHVLRFWESRFTQLKPVKRAGGRRYYRPTDMALLGGIKKLLHDDGLTIRGVQKILREQGVRYVAKLAATTANDLSGADLTTTDWVEEAPIHLDAPETARPGAEPVALHPKPARAPVDLPESPDDDLLSDDDLPEGDLPEGDLPEADLKVPPDMEEEWRAILAEEASGRTDSPPAPVQTDLFDDPPPPVEAPAPPRRPAGRYPPTGDRSAGGDAALSAAPRPLSLPAIAQIGPLPTPLATLLRKLRPGTAAQQALAPLYARLLDLRNRL